jgi:beta-glucanase (GH16 family)
MKKNFWIIFIIVLVLTTCLYNFSYSQSCYGTSTIMTMSTYCDDNSPWILRFEDNFDGNQLDTTTKWELTTYMQGTLKSSHSQEYNTLDNIHLSNGYLCITAKKETIEAKCISWLGPDVILDDTLPNLRIYNYTSSCIQTQEKYLYGRFEIRCKIPKGSFWPSFWLFGDWDEFGNKDRKNEIDVFEFRRGENKPSSNIHYDIDGDDNTESCTDHPSLLFINFSETFNTFTLIWDEYKIEWYINGNLVRRVSKYSTHFFPYLPLDCSDMREYGIYSSSLVYGYNPMQLILNLPVEKGTHTPNDSDLPAVYIIDYVRIWQKEKQNCCLSHKLYEATETFPSLTSVENYIKAGFDAGISDISGIVKVKSGQNITFRAGDYIELSGGFTVEEGAIFTAEIGECNSKQGENIEVTNFPSSFTPDNDGIDEKLFISVNGATHFSIFIEDINFPNSRFYVAYEMPIYSNPIAVWDGNCNLNCLFYHLCNRKRKVKIAFFNCQNSLIAEKTIDVQCNTKQNNNDTIILPKSLSEEYRLNETLFQLHPNPFDNSFAITLTQTEDSETVIYLTNTFGRKVLQIYSGQLEKGQHAIEVSDASLPPGMYFCIMQTPTQRKVLKVVKM